MMYRHKVLDIDRLKCVVIDCWTHLSQDIELAIDQLTSLTFVPVPLTIAKLSTVKNSLFGLPCT